MASEPRAKTQRIPELDGLRGLAALGVALFHLRIFLAGAPNPVASLPGGEWILLKGWHLVDLFFVLSGFIFAHCYLRRGRMREDVDLAKFAWARIARLVPVHVVIICFTGFMLRYAPSTTWANFSLSLFMLHAFVPKLELLNPPVWSISVELICYALFAILAITAGPRRLPLACTFLAFTGAFLILSEMSPYIGRGLLGFFVGCLVQQHEEKLSYIPWGILSLAALFPFILGSALHWVIVETLVSWPAILLLAPKIRQLRGAPLQWLGSRSYAIYLVHVPLFLFFGYLALDFPVVPTNFAVIICLATVLLVADILHRNVEIPMQHKLINWTANRKQFPREKRSNG
ncbi:acyltransferase [Qipengyuania sp. GH1]|uniref:acyltransferase family protein n=1 Tax=Qipengyuania aestuarii TaxID=2867241 RepID=UPI001C868A88|nr:acyltransferase [Qipengyuania aestuarii]MBX7534816.1 acyltransferase [Qipengyuania aestuarii]